MRSANLEELKTGGNGPIGVIASEAKGDPVVLIEALEAAGYEIKREDTGNKKRVSIYEDGDLVAHGLSDTGSDALLHAVLGAIREGR